MDRRTLNRRVPELLDIVGLDAKARQRKLREYSKGMARRIGLAQVQDVCDRITILFGGKMRELGQVKDLLQVKDITQIQARTLTETQIAEVRQFLARMGAADATVSHPTTTLEDLFMRVIGEHARVAG